jgi:hypothetical protein
LIDQVGVEPRVEHASWRNLQFNGDQAAAFMAEGLDLMEQVLFLQVQYVADKAKRVSSSEDNV